MKLVWMMLTKITFEYIITGKSITFINTIKKVYKKVIKNIVGI